ncbi:MAG: SDR family NAD(P)-dependent oxidoreductase [Saprospiraceae bacterium]
MSVSRPYVLITGGSHGIGFELAKLFAGSGFDLLLVALTQAELADAEAWFGANSPQTRVETHAKDLSLPGAASSLHHWVNLGWRQPEIVVNCAGVGMYGPFYAMNMERERAMIQLNALTTYELTRLFADDMIARGSGCIINIASATVYMPAPLLASYSATKAFVRQFSRSFDFELRRSGSKVRILTACPPGVRTGFAKAAGMEGNRIFEGFWAADAREVALDIFGAFLNKDSEVIPGGLKSMLFRILLRLTPDWLKARLLYERLKPR